MFSASRGGGLSKDFCLQQRRVEVGNSHYTSLSVRYPCSVFQYQNPTQADSLVISSFCVWSVRVLDRLRSIEEDVCSNVQLRREICVTSSIYSFAHRIQYGSPTMAVIRSLNFLEKRTNDMYRHVLVKHSVVYRWYFFCNNGQMIYQIHAVPVICPYARYVCCETLILSSSFGGLSAGNRRLRVYMLS